jgi:hypothetical protein
MSALDGALSGDISVAGLPFNTSSDTLFRGAASFSQIENVTLGNYQLTARTLSNVSKIDLRELASGGATVALTQADLTNTSKVFLQITYAV